EIIASYVSLVDARAMGFELRGLPGSFPEQWWREGGFHLQILNRGEAVHPALQEAIDIERRVSSIINRLTLLVNRLTDLRGAGRGESQEYEMVITEAEGYVSELADLVAYTQGKMNAWRRDIDQQAPKQLADYDNIEHMLFRYASTPESMRTAVDDYA